VPAPEPVLLAYADRFSAQPGETIRFMVSCAASTFNAQLFRLIHGDENPDGPGYRRIRVPAPVDATYPGMHQVIAAGSYARIPRSPAVNLTGGFTVQAWIWPALPLKPGGQAIVSTWSESNQRGFALGLDDAGHLCLDLGLGSRTERLTASEPLQRWQWTFVAATYGPATGTASLFHATTEPYSSHALVRADLHLAPSPLAEPEGDILLAAREIDPQRRPQAVFNGKLDRPKLFSRALAAEEIDQLREQQAPLPHGVVAAWDFGADISTDVVRDVSLNRLHGHTVNMPTRAVTDHTWRGEEVRWTAAPDQYAAIHFHDDDLEDAGWQPSFSLEIPGTLRSGVYAIHLTADGGEDEVPFFVRPRAGTATAEIAFVAPTLSYVAYANERMYWNEGYPERRAKITPIQTGPPDIDQYMAEHRELGLSLYDTHSDGSGCCYSSRLRPILNMRPRYRAWRLHDAPRHFASDLYLIGWLESRGFSYDVITDDDVHREGRELLARYRVLLTGSHPEYTTSAMHRAYRDYVDRGGRLMYLGGNGFYWVTSIDPRRPHVIELRRGTTGTRAWESQPGEEYHSTTGERGGLWRLRGQSPHRLVGIGFAAQGWGGAAGYSRLPDSRDPRAAFIFDGIADDEVIGDFGFILDGAAGDEIDRFDFRLGSPPHALRLATSAGKHTDYYQVTVEDILATLPGQGGTQSPNVRADMVYFETPRGGAVFSVGSINWLGSLGWNRYDNNVARVTDNVLRRFMAD
jgi:N,N-dimethylformamidase